MMSRVAGHLTKHFHSALLGLPPPTFKMFMDSIIWAIKHTMRDIADMGLLCKLQYRAHALPHSTHTCSCSSVCLDVINNFALADQQVSNAFFQQFFLSITQDIFYVLTDADHKSGFKSQSMVLARLFQLVETNSIHAPLFDPSAVPDPNISNSAFLREYCTNLLKNAFPHMQP